jgi:hypothetical protein
LLFGDVVAPWSERRDRDATRDSEECDSADYALRTMKDVCRGPIMTSLEQFVSGLVVAGDEQGRAIRVSQNGDAVSYATPNGAEVPRTDQDVHSRRKLEQSARCRDVAVKIAEQEEFHADIPCSVCVRRYVDARFRTRREFSQIRTYTVAIW